MTALYAVSKEQKAKEKAKKLNKDDKPEYIEGSIPMKVYLAESSENHEKPANVVFLKPYKNKLRVMSTGVKGIIKEMTVDRGKKMVACLMQSVQSSLVVVFNYRKERILTCTSLKVSNIEKLSVHPLRQRSVILMGKNYLRLWEIHSQEEVLKELQQLVPLKTEK